MPATRLTTLLAAALVAGPAHAQGARLEVGLANPVLAAGAPRTTYLKVALTGAERAESERAPVNVALVVDRSGSMTGQKIARARAAAVSALDALDERDIVSVVAYASTVEVLVPATRLTDKAVVRRAIERLQAGGNTALFGGVSKGAAELRKFMEREHVNRIILLSDGLANVGPSAPSDLAGLGRSLMKEGVSVTTMGLGLDYNEDLMTALAARSDGNHMFIEDATDLAASFRSEFGALLAAVAGDVRIRVECAPGVRPVRVLGRHADIVGQGVEVSLNQLYRDHEKFLLLEVEVPAGEAGSVRAIAAVETVHTDLATGRERRLTGSVRARFTATPGEVVANADRDVMVSSVLLLANEKNELAVALRDAGRVEEARQVLLDNAVYLSGNAELYDDPVLRSEKDENDADAKNLDGKAWGRQRKLMRSRQNAYENQVVVEPVVTSKEKKSKQ